MYESFYKLNEKPFSLLPDPHFLYLGDDQSLALAMLEYGLMNNTGFVVLTGPIGSGKTTLIRQILNNMEAQVNIGYVASTHNSFGSLLSQIFSAFQLDDHGLTDQNALHKLFVEFLVNNYAAGNETVLIIDEAQNIDAKALEQLRLITNINAEKDQLLNVILVGQPELRNTLSLDSMQQFAQRISVYHELKPLTKEATYDYVKNRLDIAGATEMIFTERAVEAVATSSGGVPRLINRICEAALVYGFAKESEVINAEIIENVIVDQMKAGLLISDRQSDESIEINLSSSWLKEPLSESDNRMLANWVFS